MAAESMTQRPAGMSPAGGIKHLLPDNCERPRCVAKKGCKHGGPGCFHQRCPNAAQAPPFVLRLGAGGCCCALLRLSVTSQAPLEEHHSMPSAENLRPLQGLA